MRLGAKSDQWTLLGDGITIGGRDWNLWRWLYVIDECRFDSSNTREEEALVKSNKQFARGGELSWPS